VHNADERVAEQCLHFCQQLAVAFLHLLALIAVDETVASGRHFTSRPADDDPDIQGPQAVTVE
jgi:hypothetical protein